MKIICFSSYTSIWYFALAEAAIASELQKAGHEVIYITPGNQFVGISNVNNEKILRRKFALKGYEIGSKLSKQDLKEISLIIRNLSRKNYSNLVVDNVKVGKIALYEFLIARKKMDLNFTQREWKRCLFYIKNTLVSLYACRTILKKEKPDRILMYSTLYSVNHAWEEYARNIGIPVYYLHHGLNLSDIDNTLIIAKNNSIYYWNKLKQYWPSIKDVPVNRKMLSYVTDHFLELLKAKHYLIYSSPKSNGIVDIRKIYNIGKDQKILTATMSSYDEVFAIEYVGVLNAPKKLIFGNQKEWIRELIKYVGNRKDYFLLIRIHPREFPNKREGVKSQHAKMLEKLLKNLPENVKVNWPTDGISIYDLARETDVFLNAWSTVGVEMSLLGIPVVIYSSELIHYPSELNYLARDRGDYFAKINLALKDGWRYDQVKKTYRWLALYYCRTIIRFRNTLKQSNRSIYGKSIALMLKHYYYQFLAKVVYIYPKFFRMIPGIGVDPKLLEDCDRQLTEKVDILNLEEMLVSSDDTLVDIKEASMSKITSKKEDLLIRNEIKRVYKALFGKISKKAKIKKESMQYNLRQIIV